MRHIINILLTVFIIWVGKEFLPSYIQVDTTKTMFIAAGLLIIVYYLLQVMIAISVLLIPAFIGILTTPVLIILDLVYPVLGLILLDHYLPGFHINGLLTFICLSAILAVIVYDNE